jgi:hypothetical protein
MIKYLGGAAGIDLGTTIKFCARCLRVLKIIFLLRDLCYEDLKKFCVCVCSVTFKKADQHHVSPPFPSCRDSVYKSLRYPDRILGAAKPPGASTWRTLD